MRATLLPWLYCGCRSHRVFDLKSKVAKRRSVRAIAPQFSASMLKLEGKRRLNLDEPCERGNAGGVDGGCDEADADCDVTLCVDREVKAERPLSCWCG